MSKRVGLIATGAILMVIGAIPSLGGGALLAFVGTDSNISMGSETASTPTSAFVSEKGQINYHGSSPFGLPSVQISVTGSDKPVFIGVGPTEAVDRYLAGAAVDTVTDFDVRPLKVTTTRHEGTARPAPPLDQSFWVEQAHGTTAASTNWNIRNGSYRIVVMNVDGSPGVHIDGRLSLHVPNLATIGASILAAGLLVVFLGIALLIFGLRTKVEPSGRGPVPSVMSS